MRYSNASTLEGLYEDSVAPMGAYTRASFGFLHVVTLDKQVVFSVAPLEGKREFKEVVRVPYGSNVPNAKIDDFPLLDLSVCERCEANEFCEQHEPDKVDILESPSHPESKLALLNFGRDF